MTKNIDLAIVNGYIMTDFFSLVEKGGNYVAEHASHKMCHPLEAVILGEKIRDFINLEIAKKLQCSTHWIEGFVKKDNHRLA